MLGRMPYHHGGFVWDVQCLFSARRLYQNELRQRVSANSLKPLNYIEESRLLIAQIEKLAVAA